MPYRKGTSVQDEKTSGDGHAAGSWSVFLEQPCLDTFVFSMCFSTPLGHTCIAASRAVLGPGTMVADRLTGVGDGPARGTEQTRTMRQPTEFLHANQHRCEAAVAGLVG